MVRAEGNYLRLTVVEEIIRKRERERLVSMLDLISVKGESSMQLMSEIYYTDACLIVETHVHGTERPQYLC